MFGVESGYLQDFALSPCWLDVARVSACAQEVSSGQDVVAVLADVSGFMGRRVPLRSEPGISFYKFADVEHAGCREEVVVRL